MAATQVGVEKKDAKHGKTFWHPHWKLMRVVVVIWVGFVVVMWLVTSGSPGGADRASKFGISRSTLKLALTGHIHTVRALKVSQDIRISFCWRGQAGHVLGFGVQSMYSRKYHGHLSGVYTAELHTFDLS